MTIIGPSTAGQQPWEVRGANEARIRSLEASRTADEVTLALVQTGAWTNWTPVLTASTTSPTLGTGSIQDGRYTRTGRTVNGWAYLQFGTSGVNNGVGEYRISLPVTPVTSTRNVIVGCGYLYDSSANTLEQVVLTVPANQTFTIMFKNGAFQITEIAPWTWAASDQLDVNFTYEAAS